MSSANGQRLDWIEASRANPCPKCDKTEWCRLTKGGELCMCRRLNDGTGKEKVDKSGQTYWLYRLNGWRSGDEWPQPRYAPVPKLADADTRHKVYSEVLRDLPLGARHLANLTDRGLATAEQSPSALARQGGYATLGAARAQACRKAIEAGLEPSFPGCPGLFIQEKNGRRWWTLAGGSGLLVPVRDVRQRIVALLVRLDEVKGGGGKYRYLSSKRRDGAGPGAPVHVPVFRPASLDVVRVTEGALKADIATVRSDILTIGLPGVSAWRRAAKVLRQLAAKTARLAFDADWRTNPHVAAGLTQLARDLAKNGFSIEIETWNIADGKGIDDLLAANKAPEVLSGDAAAALLAEITAAGKPANTSGTRPEMNAAEEDLHIVTPQAIAHLEAANRPPRLFCYGSWPSRLEIDSDGLPVMRPLDVARLRHEMARAIYWKRWKKVGDAMEEVSALPPKAVVEDALATPELPFPVLRRIVECPTFAADGTLHEQAGYSAAGQSYYQPGKGFTCPPVPEKPTSQEVYEAGNLLARELLGDFPFVGDAEKAHALALLLLPFCRDLIDGPAPLHLIEKPTPGTGATLLVDALLYPAIGRPVPAMTEGRDEDEWRKRIFAKLRSGPVAVNIDNLRRKLDSAALASALTAFPLWEDRLLGQSEIVRVPVRCAWVATGNNPSLSNEMTRRAVRIRLDAKTDRPWLRDGFRHPDLRAWMGANRGQLARAALVLIRAWIATGRPPGKATLGMFDSWAKTMGGIFELAGIDGFLGNLEELYEEADTDGAAWRSFVAAWWERFGQNEVGVADLWPVASEDGQLNLGDGEQQAQKTRLGVLLRSNRDRVFTVSTGEDNGSESKRLRVERAGIYRRSARWRLLAVV